MFKSLSKFAAIAACLISVSVSAAPPVDTHTQANPPTDPSLHIPEIPNFEGSPANSESAQIANAPGSEQVRAGQLVTSPLETESAHRWEAPTAFSAQTANAVGNERARAGRLFSIPLEADSAHRWEVPAAFADWAETVVPGSSDSASATSPPSLLGQRLQAGHQDGIALMAANARVRDVRAPRLHRRSSATPHSSPNRS